MLATSPSGIWPPIGRRLLRLFVLGCAVLGIAFASASSASAHASFVSASPGPGAGLAQAPGEIVLRFSEPLVQGPSRLTVVDQTGASATVGPTLPVEGDDTAMRRKLGLLAPGLYKVSWTTVSPLDGHTLKGSYQFAIGATSSGSEQLQASPISSEGPLGLAGKFVALAGLVLWFGVSLLDPVVGRVVVPASRRVLLRRIGPPLVAAGTVASLLSTALVSSGSLSTLYAVVGSGRAGLLRLALVGVAVVGTLVARWRVAAVLLAGLALVLEAASGHAGSNPNVALATVSFSAHLAAVSVWLTAIAGAVLSPRRVRDALRVFAPYAVGAAAIVAATGLASSALVLTAPRDLVRTDYGWVLLQKTAVFLTMAGFGFVHHRRRRRRDTGKRLQRPLRLEAIGAVAALALATLLVGFPDPPREAEAAQVDRQQLLSDLESAPAVSVADVSRRFTIGLTITPPRPGPVDVTVQFLGAEPGDGIRDVRLTAKSPSGLVRRSALGSCGIDCFTGRAELDAAEGAWRFRVAAASNRGHLDLAATIPLPAPDGTALFERAVTTMENLDTARAAETLRDAEDAPAITSEYRFVAPRRMRWEVTSGGTTRIAVGGTGYIRAGRGEPFESYDWIGEPFRWPDGFYRTFWEDPAAIRVLGHETVEGREVTILGFLQPSYPAWYRIAVDDRTGRVLRMEMLAERHIMQQRFGPFNEPLEVQAPADAEPRD